MKHYKILFLSMSCNESFFEMERLVVHDTWAKPLINNEFTDCGFFSYTTAQDYKERIEDNCIYVNAPDDKYHTYSKTVRALQILADRGITWDYIVRTNTSTFINVKKVIETVSNFSPDTYASIFPYSLNCIRGGLRMSIYFPTGFFYIMPQKLTTLMMSNFEEFNEDCEYLNEIRELYINDIYRHWRENGLLLQDDTLIGIFVQKLAIEDIHLNVVDLKAAGCVTTQDVPHYKTTLKNHYVQQLDEVTSICFEDPYELFNHLFLQCTIFGVPYNIRTIEIEHMYELNEVVERSVVVYRYDVINKCILSNGYESYLEIGFAEGDNFDRIICKNKEACDPCILDKDNKNEFGLVVPIEQQKKITYRMTSDEMFKQMPEDKLYDLIFIDGLHEKEQVMKDIINSMKHLNERGVIVLHDCLPPREECQTVPMTTSEWNGDVWKVFPELSNQRIFYYIVNTDYGCGILPYTTQEIKEPEKYSSEYLAYFSNTKLRNQLLHVIDRRKF